MIKRLTLSSLASVLLLAGCSSGVSSIEPLSLDEVAGERLAQMSQDEKDGIIYKFVSDSITVDGNNLISIKKEDTAKINKLLDDVSAYLTGVTNKAIKEDYANYLLLEFARTPYEWKQSTVTEIGFDPAARLYFVDVTYTTTDTYKRVIPSSKIANGSPDEEVLKQQRYSDYVAHLTYKGNGDNEKATETLTHFNNAWGDVATIHQEQQGVSLLERTKAESQISGGLGKLTYSGLIQDSKFTGGAKMTFRYVFKYNYNLGEETDLRVESLYLKDYELNGSDAMVGSLKKSEINGIEVLKPFVDKLIISYHKAVQESNEEGLYSLHYNYASTDKYYEDISNYTYNSIGGYNFEVLQRAGTNVIVKVDRLNRVRAKGSNMSLPSYDETLIFNLVLDEDDKIKIGSVNLVKSTLVGEPLSVIRNVNGVSEMINYSGESFTDTNEELVEEAVKKFSSVVFKGKVNTEEFTQVVDMGVSEVNLKKITDVVTSIPDAERKLTYIVSWDTKTNVYVSLTLREVFEKGSSSSLDTESVVDLVNRGGVWKVVNYTRTMNIKTSGVQLDSKTALVEDVR